MNDDTNDRRRSDIPWKQNLDHQLVTILTTQKVQADTLQELKEQVDELHEFLKGGLNGTDPVDTRLRDLERSAQEAKLILKGGPLGDGGLIKLFNEVAAGRTERLERRGQSLSFYAQVIMVIATLAGGIMTIWGNKIKASWEKQEKPAISAFKVKHHKNKRTAPIEEPQEEAPND